MPTYRFDGVERDHNGVKGVSAEVTYEFEAPSDVGARRKVIKLQGWNLRRIEEIPIELFGDKPEDVAVEKGSKYIVRFRATLQEVERRLLSKYPGAKSIRDARNDVNHTLWMIRRIPRLDTQRKVIAWYNWILAKVHTLKLFDVGDPELTEIRDLARRDAAKLRKASA